MNMFRFDAKSGYYIYPENTLSMDYQFWMNKGSTYEGNVHPRNDISVIKHGLKIPSNAKCYDDFVANIKESEKEFIALMITETSRFSLTQVFQII